MVDISPSMKLKYASDFKKMTSNDVKAYIMEINQSVSR